MTEALFPRMTRRTVERRRALAPGPEDAFRGFSDAVFAGGALDARTKQLIAVAVGHATGCPYCIRAHTRLARRAGASDEAIMEAIWVAAEMMAGAGMSHAALALAALDEDDARRDGGS